MTDLELLAIGRLAVREHQAWVDRNDFRKALKYWRRSAGLEPGEEASARTLAEEDLTEYEIFATPAKVAQIRLNTARAATRRAIARVLSPKPMKEHV
jgi:hypothetical protein